MLFKIAYWDNLCDPMVMFLTSICKTFAIEMNMNLTLTFRTGQVSNVDMTIGGICSSSDLMTTVIFTLAVIFYELLAVEYARS